MTTILQAIHQYLTEEIFTTSLLNNNIHVYKQRPHTSDTYVDHTISTASIEHDDTNITVRQLHYLHSTIIITININDPASLPTISKTLKECGY